MKVLFMILLIMKFVLLVGGGGLIWYGVSLVNIPASYVLLGMYCVALGFPKVEQKKGKT